MLPRQHLYEVAWGVAGLWWGLRGALALRRRSRGAAPWTRLLALVATTILATLLGARLHYVMLGPDLLLSLGWRALVLPLPEGAGLRITGGLLAGGLVIATLGPRATRRRLGLAEIADTLVPLAGVAIAIGRLGCFAEGCCFGVPCAAPWCVRFASWTPAWWSHVAQGLITASDEASLPVHPVQLYLGLSGLAATIVSSLLVRERATHAGGRALCFVLVLAGLRAAIEPLRETRFGAGVPHEAAFNLGVALVAGVWLTYRLRRQRGVGRAPSCW
ncbi:prolipoprotein diacylglyceryl transferase [Candidatus Binatia bacterium]|jgi:phosphatidylglycerol:prolipoprotein diacylglycerol transferase|nr:prolipoprotein diacylglyceryl transferase [Candidatus Binatia bacterium]